jgi:Rad3-related DNA helicase
VFRADVAQLVEHSLGKGEVISSILIIGSRNWEGHDFSRESCR